MKKNNKKTFFWSLFVAALFLETLYGYSLYRGEIELRSYILNSLSMFFVMLTCIGNLRRLEKKE